MTEVVIDMREAVEHRRNRRYRAKGGIFTVLKPFRQSRKLARVLDIGLGGLSFQYFTENKLNYRSFNAMDLYVSGDGCVIEELPITVIFNMTIDQNDPFYPSRVRRFGVEFGPLEPEKEDQLTRFIDQHTESEV